VARFSSEVRSLSAIVLFGSDGGDNLYRIDTDAEAVVEVGPVNYSSSPEIQGMANNGEIIFSRSQDSSLGFVDSASGALNATLSLSGMPADTITAMEFIGSTLYGSFHEAGPESGAGTLATIDISTGAVTSIGSLSGMNRPTGGLSYAGGLMYGITSTGNDDSALFTIDLGTGTATHVAQLTLNGLQRDAATGLVFADDTMFTILSGDSYLYSVDLGTGALTQLFDMGINMNSLTVSAVPEPSTVAAIMAGLAGLCVFWRRRRAQGGTPAV